MKRLEFTRKTKLARWEFSGQKCEAVWEGKRCNGVLTEATVQYHHEREAEAGGDNSFENCRAVCATPCHKLLTRGFVQSIRKADRQKSAALNAYPAPDRPIPSGPMPKTQKAIARAAREPKLACTGQTNLARRYGQ